MERVAVVAGTKARLRCEFFDTAETLTDPSTITFSIKVPAGTTTTYTYGSDAELVREATGIYYVDFTFSSAGVYYFRFLGAGTVGAPGEGIVDVTASILS